MTNRFPHPHDVGPRFPLNNNNVNNNNNNVHEGFIINENGSFRVRSGYIHRDPFPPSCWANPPPPPPRPRNQNFNGGRNRLAPNMGTSMLQEAQMGRFNAVNYNFYDFNSPIYATTNGFFYYLRNGTAYFTSTPPIFFPPPAYPPEFEPPYNFYYQPMAQGPYQPQPEYPPPLPPALHADMFHPPMPPQEPPQEPVPTPGPSNGQPADNKGGRGITENSLYVPFSPYNDPTAKYLLPEHEAFMTESDIASTHDEAELDLPEYSVSQNSDISPEPTYEDIFSDQEHYQYSPQQ